MEIKNRKLLAYALILIGLIALGYIAFSIITGLKQPENTAKPSTPQNTNTQTVEDDKEAESSKEPKESSYTSFDGYESILVYNLHEEIEDIIIDYMGVEEFDRQLVDYMKSKGILIDNADSITKWIYTARTDGFLTVDLATKVYAFDLYFDNMQQSWIRVTIAKGEVLFREK